MTRVQTILFSCFRCTLVMGQTIQQEGCSWSNLAEKRLTVLQPSLLMIDYVMKLSLLYCMCTYLFELDSLTRSKVAMKRLDCGSVICWSSSKGVGELTIEVNNREPVLAIKQQIEQLLGVQVAAQVLTVYGIELIDGLDLEDYPIIFDGTKIELAVRTTEPTLELQEKIHIAIKLSTRWINLEVDKSETVKHLKEKIHIIDGAPIKKITLFFSGIEMKEDHLHLCDYGICDQSEINMVYKNTSSMKAEPTSRIVSFMVQTSASLFNSAIIPLEMKDSTTVTELRKRLLDEKILPRDEYFFIHKQRIMQESCSLRWHGVENKDFLYVFKGTISREA
ncbi:hypothetical protein IFM89_007325 [Coptis chinensis]|uniref:Ubiquitin-like domain-containing protein n=1 Tax=Coptis chinensis TaxID=261450 RepID=A0A835LDS0_9MAGN|nr:hypothetical protein IFM89_007325 [Coptis chinensis]